MKIATVRDLRTRFPVVQGWIEEGEPVTITKSGKRIAVLTHASPPPTKTLADAFAKRFGKAVAPKGKPSNMAQMLIDDRGI